MCACSPTCRVKSLCRAGRTSTLLRTDAGHGPHVSVCKPGWAWPQRIPATSKLTGPARGCPQGPLGCRPSKLQWGQARTLCTSWRAPPPGRPAGARPGCPAATWGAALRHVAAWWNDVSPACRGRAVLATHGPIAASHAGVPASGPGAKSHAAAAAPSAAAPLTRQVAVSPALQRVKAIQN